MWGDIASWFDYRCNGFLFFFCSGGGFQVDRSSSSTLFPFFLPPHPQLEEATDDWIWLDRVWPSFTEFSLSNRLGPRIGSCFTEFNRVLPSFFFSIALGRGLDLALLILIEFYWIVPSFTEFFLSCMFGPRIGSCFTDFDWVLLNCTEFYRVLPSFFFPTGLDRGLDLALLILIGFYWIVPSFTEFYRVFSFL